MLLRAAARGLGLAEALAGCVGEWRDPDRVVHRFSAMLRFRMFAIACGCEDADDCEELQPIRCSSWRSAGRRETDRDLRFQPTKR